MLSGFKGATGLHESNLEEHQLGVQFCDHEERRAFAE